MLVVRRIARKNLRTFLAKERSWNRFTLKRFLSLVKPGVFPPPFVPLPLQAASRSADTAIIDQLGSHSYGEILSRAVKLSQRLTASAKETGSQGSAQIAILVPNDHRYVVCQWAAWLSGFCAVPLHHSLPESLLDYHIRDSQSKFIIVTEDLREKVSALHIARKNLIVIPRRMKETPLTEAKLFVSNVQNIKLQWRNKDAEIVYTSGTTGPPKGVVSTHSQLHAQTTAVALEWLLNPDDTVLHHLPLHHTHGIVNALFAPLYAGAKVHMLPKFSVKEVWEQLLSEESSVNVLMGVPTMYAKLIAFAKEELSEKKSLVRDLLSIKLRLCTCGSASLPDPILKDWQDVSGHMLLERYGMSEFGMGLGNPLAESHRKLGFVGQPFPGIRVRIAKRDGYSKSGFKAMLEGDKYTVKNMGLDRGDSGDLLIKGPQIFSSYFNKPEETKKAFTDEGWFITGDIASFDGDAFKILGRSSVDIIKSGGYKVSALDVERVLLEHKDILETAVVGIPDPLYGETIVAVVVASKPLTLEEVQVFSAKALPRHSVPSKLMIVESIARNTLGKVNKLELKKQLFPGGLKPFYEL